MAIRLGYCTNVHAGRDLAEMRDNLVKYALNVKRAFSPAVEMGIGLWFSSVAARQLISAGDLPAFRDQLHDWGLLPFTLNGFPYGDFHQPIVKHRVYQPEWGSPERTAYTLDLIRLLDELLPTGVAGSISTLPVAWGPSLLVAEGDADLEAAARELIKVARHLEQLEKTRGRKIVLSLEPEPGCRLQRSSDVVGFFQKFLFTATDEDVARNYLGVCHDACHAAVMFEEQSAAIGNYRSAGINIGKAQVSSAISVPFHELDGNERMQALEQLRAFAEDRYLHQTVRRSLREGTVDFSEDLVELLRTSGTAEIAAVDLRAVEWRIHFHVPLFVKRFGLLRTTQAATRECLQLLIENRGTEHFEVETYAWNVLPDWHEKPDLATGIAEELTWAAQQLSLSC